MINPIPISQIVDIQLTLKALPSNLWSYFILYVGFLYKHVELSPSWGSKILNNRKKVTMNDHWLHLFIIVIVDRFL